MSVKVLLIPAVLCLGELCSICTAPGDYTSGGYSLSFTAGQASGTLSVSTSDNTIGELEEYFKVMITRSDRPDKVDIGDPDTCFVTIQDNDGEVFNIILCVHIRTYLSMCVPCYFLPYTGIRMYVAEKIGQQV